MTFLINGLDVSPYVAYKGFKWTRNDIDGPDAGRTMDGMMHRLRVTTKIRLDITCRPLTTEETRILLPAILPEYVNVTYDDPMYGRVTKLMYSNNNPASFLMRKPNGTEWWDGITFPLVEA